MKGKTDILWVVIAGWRLKVINPNQLDSITNYSFSCTRFFMGRVIGFTLRECNVMGYFHGEYFGKVRQQII